MKTSELFTKEIEYISDETLKKIVVDTLDASPECIQTIPASSSGKYHPVYSLGDADEWEYQIKTTGELFSGDKLGVLNLISQITKLIEGGE